MTTKREIDIFIRIYQSMMESLDQVLVGQKNVKKAIAAAILCDTNSRILMTGNSGTGKTTMANFLSTSFNSERISVTSDILPNDIIKQLKNRQDMGFLQIDEFNRASGKVQSTFLELLAENQMSIEGEKFKFHDFYVFATGNSADIAGIFNVPQAVYDRFDMNIYFNGLTEEEKRILFFKGFKPVTASHLSLDEIVEANSIIQNFKTDIKDEDIMMKIFNLVDGMTVDGQKLFAGSNIRAHMFALKVVKFVALIKGRSIIFPSDIIDFFNYLYMHRIDQNVAYMGEKAVLDVFDETKNKILLIKR